MIPIYAYNIKNEVVDHSIDLNIQFEERFFSLIYKGAYLNRCLFQYFQYTSNVYFPGERVGKLHQLLERDEIAGGNSFFSNECRRRWYLASGRTSPFDGIARCHFKAISKSKMPLD